MTEGREKNLKREKIKKQGEERETHTRFFANLHALF
jgi:hypothetical protein